MARMTLEELMKRRAKRMSAFEQRTIQISHFKQAMIEYLEKLPAFQLNEIIDIDIPALTTELVEVKIYVKD